MNNTTTIRALAAIIVVVLIFTTGSLAAAETSSYTPSSAVFAYQNKGTQYNGNGNNGNTLTYQASIQAARESGFDNGLEQKSQNVICTHPGNNATCSQEGIISTTQIPLPILQPQESVTFTSQSE